MKSKKFPRIILLIVLIISLIPVGGAFAAVAFATEQEVSFQLPWDQGIAWVAIDGFDNTYKRPASSPHNYLNGGAIDFAPRSHMVKGEDTSNFWVTAAAAGTVIEKSSCHIKINHGNGWITEYQFLANIQVNLGDAVYRNQRIGIIADGIRYKFCSPAVDNDIPHLHFTLRPVMKNMTFSGWLLQYNSFWSTTTFSKNGTSLGLYKPLLNVPDLQIVLRDPITWDTVYIGTVDAYRYERWPFSLDEKTSFTITASPTTAGLIPYIVLLDANGNELDHSTGTLTSTQAAGNYFVQIQPQEGQGFYELFLTKNEIIEPSGPYSSISVVPSIINIGETALVAVSLHHIPEGGYTSVEFTCTYDENLIQVSNISATNLFGPDPAVALNGPQNGQFIYAIAGSAGNRATSDGTAFTFNVTGLQAGEVEIACRVRVSTGDQTLTEIESLTAKLTVSGVAPTPTPTPSPTPPPPATPILEGQILSTKPVTISLYSEDDTLIKSVAANEDGTFTLDAPAGTYKLVASASGFLNAQGSITLMDGDVRTMQVTSLHAGDIDGNNVIDQFDAMTIGMSYNTAEPDVADLNGDGLINVLDLEALADNYRETGPTLWIE